MYSSNGKNFYMGNDEFYLKFSSINSQDMTRIDKYTTSSVEEELNRMIKLELIFYLARVFLVFWKTF